jgi:hypothetical protein
MAPGTRNHRQTNKGIAREERENGEWISIEDANTERAALLIRGRRIVAFSRERSSGASFPDDANYVDIILDDGSRLSFHGWGYDASGLYTEYSPPQ